MSSFAVSVRTVFFECPLRWFRRPVGASLSRWSSSSALRTRSASAFFSSSKSPSLLKTSFGSRPSRSWSRVSVLIAISASVGVTMAPHTRFLTVPVVTPVPMLRRKPGPRRLRIMGQRHAKRLPKGMKPIRPGELVQIDTLFVNVAPNKAVKHFTAYDPVAKWTVALVAGRATARCAAALLDKLIAEVPFRIEGIQVDGGSEFRAEFEDACRERNLCLFVLPPNRPQLNGHVERAQGSWRYEFYGVEDLPSRLKPLQLRIDAFAHRFNHTRPHQALGDLTPAEYLSTINQEIAPSHMG